MAPDIICGNEPLLSFGPVGREGRLGDVETAIFIFLFLHRRDGDVWDVTNKGPFTSESFVLSP